jgi:hypothetical protein
MRTAASLALVLGALMTSAAQAQVNVKIGVLTDMSSLYADDTGAGSVAAAKMAIADSIRIDGRAIHLAYLFQVKSPAESKYPGDDYILKATIPTDEAFRPLKDDNCPLVSAQN